MSANYVFIKQGAASPVVPFSFTDESGLPLDLSGGGVTVTFRMRPWNSSSYTVNGQSAVILSPSTAGAGYYALNSMDTAEAGHYLAEWIINPGNLVMPVDGYIHVIISPNV